VTRFSLLLQEGIKLILHALTNAWGGEIFLSKSPAYKLEDLVEAIAPECEKQIIGLRPGERTHEDMFTYQESCNVYDAGDYYIIIPQDPVWNKNTYFKKFNLQKVPSGFIYSSSDKLNIIDTAGLKEMVHNKYKSELDEQLL
jgi:UDP-N-acetylglucosamine 4,6-dehydratase/5-epimerase